MTGSTECSLSDGPFAARSDSTVVQGPAPVWETYFQMCPSGPLESLSDQTDTRVILSLSFPHHLGLTWVGRPPTHQGWAQLVSRCEYQCLQQNSISSAALTQGAHQKFVISTYSLYNNLLNFLSQFFFPWVNLINSF